MQTVVSDLEGAELFKGLGRELLHTLAGCASGSRYRPGQMVSRAGDVADAFWLIREGRLALEIFVPGRGAVTIATITDGDIVGFSWLLPPHQMRFDIRAMVKTETVRFDGRHLRAQCGKDPVLGFQLMSRFARLAAARLEAMNLQLLDLYGVPSASSE